MGDVCEDLRILAHEKDVEVVPGQPVGQAVASVVIYDDGGDVCVDVVPTGGSAQNVACVASALLGPADDLVERGETTILVAETESVTLDVLAVYRHDEDHLFRAASLLGGEVEAWTPFEPGDESWFLASGDDVDLFVIVTVYQGDQKVETIPVSVPFVGQALAAAEKSAGTL